MKEKGSAVTATPCYQLMGSNDVNGTSRTWVDRDKYIQIACPYGFQFLYLLDIYKRAEEEGLLNTIEPHTTSLMYALGDTIYQAYGDQTNIKITTREDLNLFEGYVLMKSSCSNIEGMRKQNNYADRKED
jgi:2-C-methyl-D-erythritol 4-phosphate cytidylyltransferase